jgi:hypothetical protein
MRGRVGPIGRVGLVGLLLAPAATFAQAPKTIEPIRCWSRTSAGAVTVGQVFTLTITCAVVETGTMQVVPDESRLGVASVPVAPFELVGGEHPPDVHAGSRRFLQYHYRLRILDRYAIGHDVYIPPLTLGYRVQTRTAANSTNEGRDLSYVLPAIPVKVLSLVPADAPEIRDAGSVSLADIDNLRFRSRLFLILSVALALLAVAAVGWAVAPAAAARRVAATGGRVRIPEAAVLRAARAELDEVRAAAARADWTDELVGRALAALRLVAACAMDAGFSQRTFDDRRARLPADRRGLGEGGHEVPADTEGRLQVDTGWVRRTRALVSSPVTAIDVQRAIGKTNSATLTDLAAALALFSGAVYPQTPTRDPIALGDALGRASDLAGQLARTRRSGWRRWSTPPRWKTRGGDPER